MRRRVAYYAHDSGSGHLRHAMNVAAHPDFEVLVMSGAQPPESATGFEFERLESDVVDGYRQPVDGLFHYVPTNSANVRRRFNQIHDAMTAFQPDVVVSDVSAEVAAFAKLAGYPTIVRRMHGVRTDRAHSNMYELADQIIAYFPEQFAEGPYAHAFADKTEYLGMLELPKIPTQTSTLSAGKRHVVVLTSLGGSGVDLTGLAAAAAQTPDWHWTVLGHSSGLSASENVDVFGVIEGVDAYLANADVIVTSTGHNAVRAAVNAERPLLLFPEERMYEEQRTFARALARNGEATVIETWAQDWLALLRDATTQDAGLLRRALMVNAEQFYSRLSVAVEAALHPGV